MTKGQWFCGCGYSRNSLGKSKDWHSLMTPIEVDGYLYGVSGSTSKGGSLLCKLEAAEVIWQEPVGWQMEIDTDPSIYNSSGEFLMQKKFCL